MRPSDLLTALYPPAVRQHWGAEIREAVTAAGVRCWPDTLAGAARLWLHPGDWPETTVGQTRRTLLVALAAVTASTAMMLRCIQPSASITVDPGHPVTSLWLVPLLLGAAAVLIGAGMALAAGQGLLTAVRHPPGGASIAAYLAIGVLAAATMRAGLDLRAATSS